jgi:DNA-binding LacI/PurR family transcriptional regulator
MRPTGKTMKEIAEHLGVSRTTVSFCLAGNAQKYKIKQETSDLINAYAEEVGFSPNTMARNLVKQENDTVGLLMRRESGVEKSYTALDKSMQMLKDAGREFVFQSCLWGEVASAVRILKGMGTRSIILFGSFSLDSYKKFYYDDYKKLIPLLRGINFYMVDYAFSDTESHSKNFYCLGINKKALYFNLFDIMYKKIDGVVVCDNNCVSLEDFAEYHQSKNLAFDKAQHFGYDEINDLFLRGKHMAGQVLKLLKRLPVKVVILHNDKLAISLIDTLLQHGIKVPEDISVVGYNNIALCPYLKVPLTTVAAPIEKHIDIVMSAILKGEKISHNIKSEAKIIWRESARKF